MPHCAAVVALIILNTTARNDDSRDGARACSRRCQWCRRSPHPSQDGAWSTPLAPEEGRCPTRVQGLGAGGAAAFSHVAAAAPLAWPLAANRAIAAKAPLTWAMLETKRDR